MGSGLAGWPEIWKEKDWRTGIRGVQMELLGWVQSRKIFVTHMFVQNRAYFEEKLLKNKLDLFCVLWMSVSLFLQSDGLFPHD